MEVKMDDSEHINEQWKKIMETNKDSLKININDDGSVSVDWDKNDPRWNWMNKLTSKQIEKILTQEMYHGKI